MSKYTLPRGTQDILPDKAIKKEYVLFVLRNVADFFGFNEIQTPMFENTEVFTRSVGESSDIVNKEMYTFLDRGKRSITLRPEGTAGIIRAFVENKLYATADLPYKVYYNYDVFRYERPQAGRYRQLNQFGIESIGINSLYHDAEVILEMYHSLNELGITGLYFKINNIGDEECRTKYRKALKDYFSKYLDDLCDDCKTRYIKNPLRILDCKIDSNKDYFKEAPKISDFLSDDSKNYFKNLIDILDEYQVDYEIDDSLVRGLDYYSETVFEVHVKTDKQNYGAIGGGGRYNNLVADLGGPQLSSIGYSFGIERIILIMEEQNLFSEIKNEILAYVMPLDKSVNSYAFQIVMYLRFNQIASDIDFSEKSIKSLFKIADRKNSKYNVLVGNDEMLSNTVTIKNNKTKTQITIPVAEILDFFTNDLIEEEPHDHHHENNECTCHNHNKDEHTCSCGEDNCECDNDESHTCNCHNHHDE
ncbi:MAG: histidine--tRNA ligase [Bacilli bacterium]|nr:histidine--tRNA ligase [Bacilli bacterium]